MLFSAVRDLLPTGSVDTVEVCRDSLGRLGVSCRGVGIMDIIAFAEEGFAAEMARRSWVGQGAVTGPERCELDCRRRGKASILVLMCRDGYPKRKASQQGCLVK